VAGGVAGGALGSTVTVVTLLCRRLKDELVKQAGAVAVELGRQHVGMIMLNFVVGELEAVSAGRRIPMRNLVGARFKRSRPDRNSRSTMIRLGGAKSIKLKSHGTCCPGR